MYVSAIPCVASTLPNHDGHLAGLGTTSAPAGIFNLFNRHPFSLFSLCQIISSPEVSDLALDEYKGSIDALS